MCDESLVIDNEIASAVMRAYRGLEVNNDNLAVDVIREVGPGGIFLGRKHTLKHYKTEIWLPEISDKNTYKPNLSLKMWKGKYLRLCREPKQKS
jgi:trimethylamine--corrinoid protein Co-methyltransferase